MSDQPFIVYGSEIREVPAQIFQDFIEGTLPGVPLDKASAALQSGVRQTFEEMEITHVPRSWLGIIAVRS